MSRRRSTAPRFGPSALALIDPPSEPGRVAAYGVADFPRYFAFSIEDPALPYAIVVHVHTASDGRSSATGVQVAPYGEDLSAPLPGVTTVLEDMRVNDFVADAVSLHVLQIAGEAGEDHTLAIAKALHATLNYEPRRYRRRGHEFLEEVARVYREAFDAGQNPTAAVQAMQPPTGYSTAAAWVRQARKAGLLPPAVKGRPGWKEEEA
jgi:hypothetical protein